MSDPRALTAEEFDLIAARTDVARLEKRKLLAEVDEIERRNREDAASAYRSRIYTLADIIQPESVEEAVDTLGDWSRADPGCNIDVVISTPGGSIFDGLGFYDYMRSLSAAGHHVRTIGLSRVFSMGAVLLQAGDTRVMTTHSYLMIHEGSTVTMGKTSEIEDEAKLLKRLQDRMVTILAERCVLTSRQIKNRWNRKDWWMDAQQALEQGFIDEIQ